MSVYIIALNLLLLSQPMFADGIYKWVDADGNLHYAEKAPVGINAEKVTPDTSKVGTVQPYVTEASVAEKAAERELKKQATAEKKFKRKEEKLQAKHNCDQATRQIAQLEPRPMVLFRDKNGETRRMTNNERLDTLQKARENQKKYCK